MNNQNIICNLVENFNVKILPKIIIIVLSSISSLAISQQTYVNKEWQESTGKVGTINRTVSALDHNKHLVVVSNKVNSSNNTDVLITKYNEEGNLLWQKVYNGTANGDDYGVQVKINNNNEIFVAATLTENSGIDFGILKYEPNGNLIWANTWNGNNNGTDVPADLDIDNNGNVYLVGGTSANNNFSDYAIVKFNSNGIFEWQQTYDYANFHDVATSLKIDNSNIIVTGTSASSPTNWDITTLKVNANNGSILDSKRSSVPGVGLDNAVAVTTDLNNNTYITGYVEVNGNKNIQTVKLDVNFNLVWVKNFDGGLEDIAKALEVDNFGNIYIAGTKENTNGGKDYITIKYDANGNELWSKEFGSENDVNIAEAEKIAIDLNGDVLVTGSLDKNGTKNFATIKYSNEGDLKFVKEFDAGNQNNIAKSILIENDNIYVSGVSEINGITKNSTVKYSITQKETPIVYNSSNTPLYVENELIINFNPDYIDTNIINKKDLEFGTLTDFLHSSVISKMDSITKTDWREVKTFKIFNRLTTDITYSITRLGDTIPVPKLWSALLVKLPNNEWDVLRFKDSLNKLRPYIYFAEENAVGQLSTLPNDELLFDTPEQKGLVYHPSYPNAHINVSPAWDIEVGQQHTKVGVYDSPIYWAHEDFGDGSFSGSKIAGGWDFNTNTHISNITNPQVSHGTSCAGIIGALRNNNQGIAGIAGGDVQEGNSGVQLFSMGIFDDNSNFATWDKVAPAILEGALSNPSYGYGLHIQNHSWGGSSILNSSENDHTGMAKMVMRQCFRNQCSVVASRGNNGHDGNPINYPACMEKNWVINVSASGVDGKYKTTTNGDIGLTSPNGAITWASSYGNNVDVSAPGVTEIVSSTINPNSPIDWSATLSNSNYQQFDGTSASAPHVSGLAGLMYSHHHVNNGFSNNLAPDDVEYLVQKYATDEGAIGYDIYNGYGRINAGLTMQKIKKSEYHIKHMSATLQLTNPVFESDVTVMIPDNFYYSAVQPGIYSAKRYKVTVTVPHNIGNATIEDAWVRNSSSDLLGNTFAIYPYTNITLENYTNTSATLSGYIYLIVQNLSTQNMVMQWLPKVPGENVNWAYSLHLKDAPVSIQEKETDVEFQIYPNPISNILNLAFELNNEQSISYSIYDIAGKLVYNSINKNYPKGKHEISVNHLKLSQGLYNLSLRVNEKYFSKKLIIINK